MNWGDIKEACKRLDDHLTDGVYAHGRHLAGLDRSAAPPSRRAAAIQRLDFAAPASWLRRFARRQGPGAMIG